MEAIRGFLSNYSVNFELALVAWPFFAIVLTMPILAYLYHRDGRLKLSVVCGAYIAVLYLLSIVCFAFYPLPTAESGPGITYGVPPQWNPLGFIGDIQKDGLKAVFQLLFNVVFFVPLGFIAGYLLRMRAWTTAVFVCAVSALVEVAQLTGLFGIYDHAYRCCDVDDLICNSIGGVLGWFCARALGSRSALNADRPEVTRSPGFIRRCTAFWIDMTIIGCVAFISWIALVLISWMVWKQPFELFSLNQETTMLIWQGGVSVVMFAIVEIVVPWRSGGSTIGGSFVHMTCETRERTHGYRVLFYVMRTLTFVIALVFSPFMFPILALYYLIKRCMPYDSVPSEEGQ